MNILFDDPFFVVVNKPATVPSVPDTSGDESALEMMESQIGHQLFPVNRIDRPTSGILLFAKTVKATNKASDIFQNKKAQKIYLGFVSGKIEDNGTINSYVRRDGKRKKSVVTEQKISGAKLASLEYSVLTRSDHYALLKIEPKTGRFHQIRAQLSSIGHPIKGDVKYGSRRSNRDRSIHLHAWKLEFEHPFKKETVSLEAPLPEESLWNFARTFIVENEL